MPAPPQTNAPDFVLRGRGWKPLPFPIVKPPASQPDRISGGDYVLEQLGEIQPGLMADGFAALLAGRQPDEAFAALQEWFAYQRRGAIRDLNESADRAAWGRLIDEAVAWTRFECLYPIRSTTAMDELLARVQDPNAYRYENLWDFAFNCDRNRAFAEAARLLGDPKSPASARRMLIGRIVAHAPRSDGGAEAAVLARCLDDEHPPIAQIARDSLVSMLVDRGGRSPGGPHTAWSHCQPGALNKCVAALKRELGEAGYQRMLHAHPQVAVAVVPRKSRSPWYDSPANTGELPEALGKFAGGRLADPSDTAAWQALYEHWHQPFALDAMVRGMVLDWSGANDWPRHQCMEGLVRWAILWPDKVRAALARYDAHDSPHLQAVRCYVVPGYDARVFADRMKDWGYPVLIGQAVAWTENGQVLIGKMLGDPTSDIRGNHGELRRLAERWYGPEFVQRMLPPTMRDTPPAAPSDDEVAAAVKLVGELIAQAARRTPLSLPRKQFEPYEKAVWVLIRARDPDSCKVLAEFLRLRPYERRAHYGGDSGPWAWDCFPVLSAMLACDSPLYFRTLLDFADDPDPWWGPRSWNHLAELTGGHAAGESLPAVVKALAERPHMTVPDIRVEALRLLGVAIGDPRSKEGIEALTAALVGRPGVPLVDYSRGHDDDLIRSLAEQVLADQIGPRGSAAYGVVRCLPEPKAAAALSAALQRLVAAEARNEQRSGPSMP